MKIKSWFTKRVDSGVTILNTETELLSAFLDARMVDSIRNEIVEKIAIHFLEVNSETIKNDILHNPEFANAVYNAIVLKKAEKI